MTDLVPEALRRRCLRALGLERGRRLSYWRVHNAQHFDAFLGPCRHWGALPSRCCPTPTAHWIALWAHAARRRAAAERADIATHAARPGGRCRRADARASGRHALASAAAAPRDGRRGARSCVGGAWAFRTRRVPVQSRRGATGRGRRCAGPRPTITRGAWCRALEVGAGRSRRTADRAPQHRARNPGCRQAHGVQTRGATSNGNVGQFRQFFVHRLDFLLAHGQVHRAQCGQTRTSPPVLAAPGPGPGRSRARRARAPAPRNAAAWAARAGRGTCGSGRNRWRDRPPWPAKGPLGT